MKLKLIIFILFLSFKFSSAQGFLQLCSNSCTTCNTGLVCTDLGIFGCRCLIGPVPIELLEFKGENDNEKNILYWSTSSETNNDYFTIEKSKNAIDFEIIQIIKGAGNSTTLKEYYCIDYNPFPNITYYRLKQTDYNGDYMYSDIISVSGFQIKLIKTEYYNFQGQKIEKPKKNTLYIEYLYYSNNIIIINKIINQ